MFHERMDLIKAQTQGKCMFLSMCIGDAFVFLYILEDLGSL